MRFAEFNMGGRSHSAKWGADFQSELLDIGREYESLGLALSDELRDSAVGRNAPT